MKHKDVLERLRQDPEYVKAEKELGPLLDVAADVIRLREEKGWTQEELARRVGTRQANISRLENGLGNPTLNFLQKVARALNTELTLHMSVKPATESIKVMVERVVKVVRLETPWEIKRAQYPSPARWSVSAPLMKDVDELDQYKAA